MDIMFYLIIMKTHLREYQKNKRCHILLSVIGLNLLVVRNLLVHILIINSEF